MFVRAEVGFLGGNPGAFVACRVLYGIFGLGSGDAWMGRDEAHRSGAGATKTPVIRLRQGRIRLNWWHMQKGEGEFVTGWAG